MFCCVLEEYCRRAWLKGFLFFFFCSIMCWKRPRSSCEPLSWALVYLPPVAREEQNIKLLFLFCFEAGMASSDMPQISVRPEARAPDPKPGPKTLTLTRNQTPRSGGGFVAAPWEGSTSLGRQTTLFVETGVFSCHLWRIYRRHFRQERADTALLCETRQSEDLIATLLTSLPT